MGHFTIHLKKGNDATIFIERAAEVIKEGGIIAFPTETVYAIGVDPFNTTVIKELVGFKSIENFRGFPILVSDLNEGKKIGIFSKYEMELASKYWPGPLTLVVPRHPPTKTKSSATKEIYLDDNVTQGADCIAIRVSKHPIVIGICNHLKTINTFGGIISTSASLSEGKEFSDGKQVVQEFSTMINYILEMGKCELGTPSTVVKINHNILKSKGSIKEAIDIIREGPISVEDISQVLSKV
jgi:L-threonylcarbamoyladenylate synthase